MAISFPSNPALNEVYTYNGTQYVWDGVKWISGGQTNYDSLYVSKNLFNAQLVGTDASGDLINNDAPADGSKYTRQNGGWSEITEAGGDFITVEYSGAAAWGLVSAAGSLTSGLNIASVTRSAAAVYDIVFSTPMPSSDYAVVTDATTTVGKTSTIKNKSTTGFTVEWYLVDTGGASNSNFSFAVHALNALPPTGGTGADAWASTNSAGDLSSSFNIASVTRSATGVFDYVFTTPMPTDSYAVIVAPDSPSGERTATTTGKTTTGFTVKLVNLSGAPANNGHSVVVHSTTAALPNTILKEDLLYSDGRQAVTGGIPFNTSPVADPNTLDDYEEGTFTPFFQPSDAGSGFSATYSNQVGIYTKIGNLVTCQIRLEAATASGGTGNARIGGLPFTSSGVGGGAIGSTFGWSGATRIPDLARISNGDWIGLNEKADTGGVNLTISDVTSALNPAIWLTISYRTDE